MDTEERNIQYLNQKVIYTDDGRLLDEEGNAVMMGWEIDIMEDIAKILCKNKGKILNVGFGLGLIDEFIELEKPKEHWIIEAHPDVINYMKTDKKNYNNKINLILLSKIGNARINNTYKAAEINSFLKKLLINR